MPNPTNVILKKVKSHIIPNTRTFSSKTIRKIIARSKTINTNCKTNHKYFGGFVTKYSV